MIDKPLLRTKLFVPPPLRAAVPRPRLLEHLEAGLRQGSRLTLVCAPAGYGKSMLVAGWLGQWEAAAPEERRASWLSLDENDNDPGHFLAYLAAALQRLDATVGQSLQSLLAGRMLESPNLPPLETLLTGLINDLSDAVQPLQAGYGPGVAAPGSLILVLDDYHKIRLPYLHETIQFLLDRQPPHFHLVLITREDPPLQIPRLRVRGEITEVRAGDLRFTTQEASQFFQQVMRLELAPEWIELLVRRTEGWVAGLQLAAIALRSPVSQQGRPDIPGFLEDFHGSHRFVIDYLMDEVLSRQSGEVRQFLYQTAILDRLSASLCEAVTGRADSEDLLHQIEQSNLFLIPLDERREWYRYHQLFGDFLRLGQDDAQQAGLHQKASGWFEANGYLPEAVAHSLAARDFERAARQIDRAAGPLIGAGELATVLGWINALPQELVGGDVDLLSHQASCLYFTGQVEAALRVMANLDEAASARMDPLNRGRLLSLQAWMANAREEDRTVDLALQAISLIGAADPLIGAISHIPLGHGYRRKNELTASALAYREAIRMGQQAGHLITVASACNSLALLLDEQGKRQDAFDLCQETRRNMLDRRGRPLPVAELLGLSQAVLAYEANELEQAIEEARTGREASQRLLSSRVMGGEAERVLVRAYAALGDFTAAGQMLREARQQGAHLSWVIPQLDALQADLALRQGNLDATEAWARASGIPADVGATSRYEQSYTTYARLLLAQNRPEEARGLLAPLAYLRRLEGRVALLITIAILQSRAEVALGDKAAAFQYMEQALKLAAPGRYLRRFLDEGKEVRRVVADLAASIGIQPASEMGRFVRDLLAVFSPEQDQLARPAGEPEGQPGEIALLEPLSEQERKILRLLCAGLSNAEIASELVIGLGTAKWHVHNIYGKLGVSSRTQAIARAQDQKLI